jgi:hypothetical protein
MAEVLDEDFETVDEAAAAVLDTAWEIVQQRAKFTVVGQAQGRGDEPAGDKVALGWYATQRQATNDALKLAYSAQTNETHLAWVLPVFHGTPNDYYVSRKNARKDVAIADGSARERELQRRLQWCKDHPNDPPPERWGLIPFDSEVTDCERCNGTGKRAKTREEIEHDEHSH